MPVQFQVKTAQVIYQFYDIHHWTLILEIIHSSHTSRFTLCNKVRQVLIHKNSLVGFAREVQTFMEHFLPKSFTQLITKE